MPAPWTTFPIQGSRLVSAFRGDFNVIIEALLSAHISAEEPIPQYPGMFWADISGVPALMKQRNAANTQWKIRFRLDEDWGGMLSLLGGTMEGALDMDGNAILNLPLGSGNAPARYADLAPYAKLDGTTPFTGIPSGPATDPSSANQFTRKSYVDTKAVAGGTFAAQITLPTAPAAGSNQCVRQVDLDARIDAHTHSGAANQGPKIQGTNVGSAGPVAAGQYLESNGSGGAAWAAPYWNIFDGPLSLYLDQNLNTFAGGVYPSNMAEVNVSGQVSARARVAILEGALAASGVFRARFATKPSGGAGSPIVFQQQPYVTGGSLTAYEDIGKVLIFARLSSTKRFMLGMDSGQGAGGTQFSLWLIGEL